LSCTRFLDSAFAPILSGRLLSSTSTQTLTVVVHFTVNGRECSGAGLASGLGSAAAGGSAA